MKDLVVDSGISVKWFIAETDSAIALEILKDYRNEKNSFLAPNLIYAEFGNIIWKKQIFQGIDPLDADLAIQEFKKISFILTPISTLFDDAFQIGIKYKRTFYDSFYLALSVKESCAFVTADEKFYNAVK
ncbi:MAG: type II toxin-antitoxin system VapC family toxin [Acidobacteria bacterium]|nr:type II toxin-antitoxin system VapC family toxin [Acidobacteriota bacterium]